LVFERGLAGDRITGRMRGISGENQGKGQDEAGTHGVLQFRVADSQRGIVCAPLASPYWSVKRNSSKI
jgi:hypothetical protein